MTSDNGWTSSSGPVAVNPYALTPGNEAGVAPWPASPAYGAPYGFPVAPVRPLPPLASWIQRVGAMIVDQAVPTVLSIIGGAVWLPEYVRFMREMSTMTVVDNGQIPDLPNPFGPGYLVLMLLSLVGFGFNLWNRTFRQGRTGQSIGKQLVGLRLLDERTMAPMGAGMSFVRELAHTLDGFFYVGYLWPLWDDKRQTFADKVCRTVVAVDG